MRFQDQETQRLYWVWAAMKSRCLNPNNPHFHNYGGRGIGVCDDWLLFKNFLRDVGVPAPGMLLDRIDNDKGYSPDNCRWSTRTEQNSNRRYCIHVDDGGETVTLKEYCRRKRITYRVIIRRIRDFGWPIDRAIDTPISPRKGWRYQ